MCVEVNAHDYCVRRSAKTIRESNLRQPSYSTLVRLANLYGVTTDYLLGRTNDKLLDISGLTHAEATIIMQLVASMTAKNQKLEDITL